MTIRDRSKVKMPPCPVCGAVTATSWVDIRRACDPRAEWVPGRVWCTANEDHDVTSLRAYDWAFETPGPRRSSTTVVIHPSEITIIKDPESGEVLGYLWDRDTPTQ